MKDLTEVYNRLKMKKAERKDLRTSIQDELKNDKRYQDLIEKINELKIEKKSIENEIMSRELDRAKLEELNLDIKTDVEMLTDITLNMFLAQEPVEIVDEVNNKWTPVFAVRFRKG
ncbi:MAG: hypothetical protein WAZ14_02810 [Patescibacteria group bacterium]